MRDPKRIKKVLNTIERVWNKVPDWRLGQLIVNATKQNDPFYVDDNDLIVKLDDIEKNVIDKDVT